MCVCTWLVRLLTCVSERERDREDEAVWCEDFGLVFSSLLLFPSYSQDGSVLVFFSWFGHVDHHSGCLLDVGFRDQGFNNTYLTVCVIVAFFPFRIVGSG
jgi:hypothetical protein